MAYLSNFAYDIFISYSHVDNETISDEQCGWIEQFYKNLNLLLAKRTGKMDAVKIWWDNKKLDGSKLFDESIATGIQQSAILLSLISPGYLSSDYCQQELSLFHKKATAEPYGLKIGDRCRLFNILLNNIPYGKLPEELQGTTGFPFHDATDKESFGDPLDPSNPLFIIQLKQLRDAIINLFDNFPKATTPIEDQQATEEVSKEPGFTIFFGEVADTLRTVRKRAISELEKSGYTVLYGVPPPDDAAAHELKVKELLAQTHLSVHLLDQYPGKEIVDTQDIWYPQKQTELALASDKKNMIWVPLEMDIAEIEEDKYKSFVKNIADGKLTAGNYEFIRGSKSTVTQQITELAEQLKTEQKTTPAKGKVSVLLDTHMNDQLYAMDVGRALLENEIQPFINPQEDDPRKNINLLAERISQVNKLIFFYGKVSRDWVLERMSAALQLIVSNNYPVEDFYIYLAPPHKDPKDISLKQRFLKVNVIDNSSTPQMNSQTYQFLLKELKGMA